MQKTLQLPYARLKNGYSHRDPNLAESLPRPIAIIIMVIAIAIIITEAEQTLVQKGKTKTAPHRRLIVSGRPLSAR